MVMPGLDVIAVTGLLALAGGKIQCTVPKPPSIVVSPVTREIEYDFTKSASYLGGLKNDTHNPYPSGVDTTTGGLRQDRPETTLAIKWGYIKYPEGDVCLWYDDIKLKIELKPHIFVAKDFEGDACRQAILAHERRHVSVDREVVNKYTQKMGQTVRAQVDRIGAVGPYPVGHLKEAEHQMVEKVKDSFILVERAMREELLKKQAAVDSLAEYEQISKVCRDSRKKR